MGVDLGLGLLGDGWGENFDASAASLILTQICIKTRINLRIPPISSSNPPNSHKLTKNPKTPLSNFANFPIPFPDKVQPGQSHLNNGILFAPSIFIIFQNIFTFFIASDCFFNPTPIFIKLATLIVTVGEF